MEKMDARTKEINEAAFNQGLLALHARVPDPMIAFQLALGRKPGEARVSSKNTIKHSM